MSKQVAAEFMRQLNTNMNLRSELASETGSNIIQINSGDRAFGTELVDFAAKHGYTFDVADARDAYKDVLEQQVAEASRELSEQELETVAGGVASEGGCCLTSVSRA